MAMLNCRVFDIFWHEVTGNLDRIAPFLLKLGASVMDILGPSQSTFVGWYMWEPHVDTPSITV